MEAVKRLGISACQLRNLHGHGIPRQANGLYPWPVVRDWYIRFKQDEQLDARLVLSPDAESPLVEQ